MIALAFFEDRGRLVRIMLITADKDFPKLSLPVLLFACMIFLRHDSYRFLSCPVLSCFASSFRPYAPLCKFVVWCALYVRQVVPHMLSLPCSPELRFVFLGPWGLL